VVAAPPLGALAVAHVNPPTDAFITTDLVVDLAHGRSTPAYQWVDGDAISRNLLVALVAHEDQQFLTRNGPFTIDQFIGRADDFVHGRRDPSGSTIEQQVAKNLFFWRHKDPIRKGLEAYTSWWLYHTASRKRVLELYANTIEFGPNIFGACAASWFFFDEP